MADASLYNLDLLSFPEGTYNGDPDWRIDFPFSIYPIDDMNGKPFDPPEFTGSPSRPRRQHLIGKFFPEIAEQLTKGDREAVCKLSLLASEAILKDFIDQFDKARQQAGHQSGVLVVHLACIGGEQHAHYYPIDAIFEDLHYAEAQCDNRFCVWLQELKSQIEAHDVKDYALICITDRSTAQFFPVPRDQPARALADAINAHAAA